jgi:hypothetical protein
LPQTSTSSQQLSTPETYGQQYPQPNTGTGTRRIAPRTTTPQQTPLTYPNPPYALSPQPYPQLGPEYPLNPPPPTDAELVQRNLPPLRGPWNANGTPATTLDPRAQNELDLATLEASFSGWLGGTAIARYRSGTAGLDQLFDLEAPAEISFVLAKTVRFSILPRAVFLNNGVINLTNFTTSSPGTQFLGSLDLNSGLASPPQQQVADGVGGELQLTTTNIGVAVGYTPYQFLVRNILGHARWKILGGPITIFANRDNVKDSMLSYAGLRDPGQATPIYSGPVWGGVVQTGGGLRFDHGNERSGFYAMAEGADLSGVHTLENREYDGSMGAYWRAKVFPGYGVLNLGANFFGEHYANNELPLSYGNGGYFSPEAYFLAAIPITFNGYHGTKWHYIVGGAIGLQAFEEDNDKFFPLDQNLESGLGCSIASLTNHTCGGEPISTNVGLNYNLDLQGAYHITDHWYIGGFITGNNTSNYNTISGGFFVRWLFKPQYPTESYPTGFFPHDGFRPLRVP